MYRSHYEGPLSKVVRRLPDATVLDWFRRGWRCDDPESWVESELGTDVYGLDSIFEAVEEEGLRKPRTVGELRNQLHEHLYVEGDEDCIRLDEHSLRVRTDDDEVALAYFFFDDETVRAAPDRLAYLLQEWPLPEDVGPAATFTPQVPVTEIGPAGTADATTYAVFLTFYDGDSLAQWRPAAFPGVDLAGLPAHLRALTPGPEWLPELQVLRALVAPEDDAIAPALERCNRWPGFNLNWEPWSDMPDAHADAHRGAMDQLAMAKYDGLRRPETSLLRVGEHLAQLAMHCSDSFGYQQWFLFDSVWAATHPDLAQSLLRYAEHWDPLSREHAS
ncbi:hypothetical protein ACFQX7_32095 [Luedemannella flava]